MFVRGTSQRRVTLAGLAMMVCASGCASMGKDQASRSSYSGPLSAASSLPDWSGDSCGRGRAAGLTVFNRDGSLRWNLELPASEGGEDHHAPLATSDQILSSHTGAVTAVSAANGSVAWDQQLGTTIDGSWLIDGLLVADVDQGTQPRFVGLDPATGEQRWSYAVPDDRFVGEAVPTDDGGLVFRTGTTDMLIAVEASDGSVRWMHHVDVSEKAEALPSVGPGVVLYVDRDRQLIALDSRTGALRWHASAGQAGHLVVSEDVGVVVPDVISGSTLTVVAHSLEDGTEVWHRQMADLSGVFPDASGFLLLDYRANTMTLVRPTANPIWQAQLSKITDIDNPPTRLDPDGALAEFERAGVAFVDHGTGDVRQLPLPDAGYGYATTDGRNGLVVGSDTRVFLTTANGVTWQNQLPHYIQNWPAVLDDGGIAIQTDDPVCAVPD